MRFFALATGLFAALAAAASTSNPFIQPVSGSAFTAGGTSTLEWTPSTSGTVSLRLQWGALTTATEGLAIASSIDNTGTFSWTVPADIPKEADYFIRIASDDDTSEVNYSARFTISGVTGVSSVTASASTSFSSAASTTLVTTTSTSASSTSTSTTSTSTSSSSSTSSTPSSTSTTSVKTTATPSPTTTPASSSPAVSTIATTSSPAASATTSVPNLNGGESVRVPGLLMGVVGLGAFVML